MSYDVAHSLDGSQFFVPRPPELTEFEKRAFTNAIDLEYEKLKLRMRRLKRQWGARRFKRYLIERQLL